MTILELYLNVREMTKDDVVKVIDSELHVKYYGPYKRTPEDLLHKQIDGYRFSWGECTIWLS